MRQMIREKIVCFVHGNIRNRVNGNFLGYLKELEIYE